MLYAIFWERWNWYTYPLLINKIGSLQVGTVYRHLAMAYLNVAKPRWSYIVQVPLSANQSHDLYREFPSRSFNFTHMSSQGKPVTRWLLVLHLSDIPIAAASAEINWHPEACPRGAGWHIDQIQTRLRYGGVGLEDAMIKEAENILAINWYDLTKDQSMTTTLEVQDFSLWEKMKARRSLLSFELELTARCNNDCRHCYINLPANDKTGKERELSLAEISNIADQAVELGAMWCLLTGGEPLLREDFEDVYMVLKRKGLLVSIFTNATVIRARHIELFKKYPPRDIEVTIYGASKDSYERVTRRPGSYTAFVRGLDMLFKAGVKVRLKAMALHSNMDDMEAIAAFGYSRTKDYYRFDPQLHLRYDGDPIRNEEIKQERLTPEEIVALERADTKRFGALQNGCDTLINQDFTHRNCNHLFHCGAGNGNFSIGFDGTFRLCSALWAPGTTINLRETPLREAWDKLVPQVLDMRSDDPEYLDTCRKCEFVNLCLWCPAHAYLETGRMDGATPYFCAVAHARAKAISSKMAS